LRDLNITKILMYMLFVGDLVVKPTCINAALVLVVLNFNKNFRLFLFSGNCPYIWLLFWTNHVISTKFLQILLWRQLAFKIKKVN